MRAESGATGSLTRVPSASGTRTASAWAPSSGKPSQKLACGWAQEEGAQAEAVRAQSEQLIASLRQARRQLVPEREPGQPERRQPDARPSYLTAVDPVAEPVAPAPTVLRPATGETTAAGARLLATQMAVSGSSREEIEARLRNGFEIEDTAAIVDAILGPEE